jgi:hypothetical protein
MASNRRNTEALEVLAEVDGHLLADIRAMRHWATLDGEPAAGMGRLNFALMAVALIGCERLGFLVGRRQTRTKGGCSDRDPGGYIISFIDGFFSAKHPFKLIPKILADSMRHQLVHGFGGRSTTAPFELGLYVSNDPTRLYEVRTGTERPTLAINALAFADGLLAAFARLHKRVAKESDLAEAVVANGAIPFTTPAGVVAEWNNRVLKRVAKRPSNERVEPTAFRDRATVRAARRRGSRADR